MFRLCAILGPSCLLLTATILAAIQPDYEFTEHMISELGAMQAPYANWFNYAGFLPNGICILLFGFFLFAYMTQHNFHPLAAVLVVIHGFGMLLATWLSCDLSCTPAAPSNEQLLHNLLAIIKFPALHLATLVIAIQLLRRSHTKIFAYWSFFTYLIVSVFLFLFISSIETRDLTGVWQRLLIISLYTWLISLALYMPTLITPKQTDRQV